MSYSHSSNSLSIDYNHNALSPTYPYAILAHIMDSDRHYKAFRKQYEDALELYEEEEFDVCIDLVEYNLL